jgi:hypothetical protein
MITKRSPAEHWRDGRERGEQLRTGRRSLAVSSRRFPEARAPEAIAAGTECEALTSRATKRSPKAKCASSRRRGHNAGMALSALRQPWDRATRTAASLRQCPAVPYPLNHWRFSEASARHWRPASHSACRSQCARVPCAERECVDTPTGR